jgi:TetR/AcrR family transcriptional regulator, cholesterol catabolism regulator
MTANAIEPTRRSAHHDSTTAEGDARRQLVLDKAALLFAEHGFENTTLSDIAEAADLRKPSVYHYFPSKHSILLAVLTEGMDEIWRSANEAAQIDDLTERFQALFDAHLHNFQRRLAHVVVFLLEQRRLGPDIRDDPDAKAYMDQRRAYDHLFIDCIRQGQRVGLFRRGDPAVLAYGILGMVNWMVQWYDPNGRLSMDEIGAILRGCAISAVLKPPVAGRGRKG